MPEKKRMMSEEVPITRAKLSEGDAVITIGAIAAKHLRRLGVVTMVIDQDEEVRVANPLFVYIDEQAFNRAEMNEELRYIRPIVSDGKPQLVAFKGDELWEVEVRRKS